MQCALAFFLCALGYVHVTLVLQLYYTALYFEASLLITEEEMRSLTHMLEETKAGALNLTLFLSSRLPVL